MRRPLQSLEDALGRSLRAQDRGSVETLNDLPDELVREARALNLTSRVASTEYLRYYVKKAEVVDGFIQDVLEHDKDSAAEWGKRDVMCFPHGSAASCAVLDETALLAPLNDIDGERWRRVVPTPEGWDWSGVAGAPGVLIRAAPYWFEPPETIEYGDVDSEILEDVPVDKLHIAVRRWLASRVAWELRRHDPAARTTIEDICAGLGLEPACLSVGAKAAIQGLLRSGWPRSIGSPIPGFDGPDDWYR